MSERLTQTGHPIIGTNIKRLRTERNMRAVDVIAKLQLKGIKVTTGIYNSIFINIHYINIYIHQESPPIVLQRLQYSIEYKPKS